MNTLLAKLLLIGAAGTLSGTGLPAESEPMLLPDGEVFDSAYYAESNPDVATAFGTDFNLLYQHYTMYGRSEGRLPFDPSISAEDIIVSLPVCIGDRIVLSTDKEVDLSGLDLRGLDMEAFFAQMPYLEKLTLIGCKLDNAGYAALQDAHPDIRMIWEIVLPQWRIRTDAVGFSTMRATPQDYRLIDRDAYYLRYCTDMVALDIGHNTVHDLSFLQYMPNLQVFIIVDDVGLTDLSMLANCPKLRYLEFFVNRVSDLSFLQYTPEIEDLNISYNSVSSIEYLTDLPNLKRLWMECTRIPYSDFQTLQQLYPDVEMVYYGDGSVDQGWRTGERYRAMRDIVIHNRTNDIYY